MVLETKLSPAQYQNSSGNAVANALASILQPGTYEAVDVSSTSFTQENAVLGFKIFIPANYTGGNIVATPFGNSSPITFAEDEYTKGECLLISTRFKEITTDTATKDELVALY
jgi:hypothetical protein